MKDASYVLAELDRSHMERVYDIAAAFEREAWSYYWVVQGVRPILEKCGSPIEEMLAVALWSKAPSRGADNNGISPQVQIGPYRVDFVLDFHNYRQKSSAQLVVEVDGHDFHEKTKEQVRHDKARDRYLLGLGHQVARFAGSEVFADPFRCAGEAWDLAKTIARQESA